MELFFKWIRQHLRIKAFYGTSPNAVRTQLWIAVTVYVLGAIIRKQLKIEASLFTILQVLSRNDAIEFRVERATGPFCRATSPTVERTMPSPNGVWFPCVRRDGKLPPRTARLAVPPRPTAWFRLSVSTLDKTSLPQLLAQAERQALSNDSHNQLLLFNQ